MRVMYLFVACCAMEFLVTVATHAAERPVTQTAAIKSKSSVETVETREFEVRVDNRAVGTNRFTIKSNGDRVTVDIQTDVKVDIIVYSYSYKFQATETWLDGRLTEHRSKCDDNGKKRNFSLAPESAGQKMTFNDKTLPGVFDLDLTTAYWKLPSAEIRDKRLRIGDTDKGVSTEASLKFVGNESVADGNKTVTHRHFKIDGPAPAELWFDDQDIVVRQKSIEQGHVTELKLKKIQKQTQPAKVER